MENTLRVMFGVLVDSITSKIQNKTSILFIITIHFNFAL